MLPSTSSGSPSSQTVSVDLAVAGHEVTDSDLRRVTDHYEAHLAQAALFRLVPVEVSDG